MVMQLLTHILGGRLNDRWQHLMAHFMIIDVFYNFRTIHPKTIFTVAVHDIVAVLWYNVGGSIVLKDDFICADWLLQTKVFAINIIALSRW